MIVHFDIDSLVYSSCYNVETFEDATHKFDEVYQSIINKIEEDYDVLQVYNYGFAKGNFRKILDKNYKANRTKPKPKYYYKLVHWVQEYYNVIKGHGVETDDMVAKGWIKGMLTYGKGIIISIDKDYMQLPALIYNYGRKVYYDLNEEEARRNFWCQIIEGDSGDNVNYAKGYGLKWTEKHFKDCLTDFSYIKVVYGLFKKIYHNKARERFIQCYNLIKLRYE